MKRVFRTDRGSLKKPERTPQGFLRVEGHVGRAGIYQYVNTAEDEADGFGKAGTIRNELRPDDEVFSERALASLADLSITVGHPRDAKGKEIPVTADNVRQFEVGSISGARRDVDRVAVTHVIKDKRAIASVEAGRQELSPGYTSDVELTAGVDPKYGRYDCIQRNIVYNHIALVDHARGGSTLRLRMDDGSELVGRVDASGRFFRADESPQFAVGARVVALVDHMPGMRDKAGTVTTAREGTPPYYGVTFDGDTEEHRWLAEDEISGTAAASSSGSVEGARMDMAMHATGAQRRDGEIDRSRASKEGERMGNEAGTENPNDTASKLRLQQVRADEQEQLASQRKLRIDELEVQVGDLTGKLTTANESIAKLNAQLAAGATAVETEAVRVERTRADEAELKLKKLQDSRNAEVNDRAEIVVRVRAIMGPKFRTDALTNDALCEAAIKAMRPKEDLAGKNSAYLRSRFDSLCEERMLSDASQARASAVLATTTAPPPATTGTSKHSWRDQWKAGLPDAD